MLRFIQVALLATVLLLAACRPQQQVVEVTRLVQEQVPFEVTRIVNETVVQEATRVVVEEVEVVVEVTQEPLGSLNRPVQLLFPPRFEADLIAERGEPLAGALRQATGREYRIGILDSEQTVIDVMCAAPADTIAFLSPAGYVVAHDQCAAQIGNVAVAADTGLTTKMGMLVTREDSGIAELQDLDGRRWAVPDENSLTNHYYFLASLLESGVDVQETLPLAGESVAMLAVYEEDVDVASAEFIPPILPYEERLWDSESDNPEPWRALGLSPQRSPIGYVLLNGEPEFGGYRLRDARSRVFDVVPDIFDATRILSLSAPVPNDTIAFGPDFPLALARQLQVELATFAAGSECRASLCSTDFYGWGGLAAARDDMYEPLRFVQETLDLTAEDLLRLTP